MSASNTAPFTAIGQFDYNANVGIPFSGVFDGQGHKIGNLTISTSPNSSALGLFAYSTGIIRNVGLVNVSIDGLGSLIVGGLVGKNGTGGVIAHSYVTGSVGGLTSGAVGGLVGWNDGTIIQSYADVSIKQAVGIDQVDAGTIAGRNLGAVKQSYGMGSLQANGLTAGLVGNNAGTISESYAGAVAFCCGTTGQTRGLVSSNAGGTIDNSYWDAEASGQSIGVGGTNGLISNVFGLSTNRAQLQATYTTDPITGSNWDFTNVWGAPASTTAIRFCSFSSMCSRHNWETSFFGRSAS